MLIPVLAITLRLDGLDWWEQSGYALLLFTATSLLIKNPNILLAEGFTDATGSMLVLQILTVSLKAVLISSSILAVLFISLH